MLRVRSSALTTDDEGRSCYLAAPFSGLAYRVDDDGVVSALAVVEQGKITGASDDWLALPEGGSRVARTSLETAEDYGPLLWQSAPFTGVVYFFDRRGACVVEEAYVAGYATEEARRAWFASGALQRLVQGEEGSTWFEDGRLQAKGVGDTVLLNLVMGDDGRLAGLVLGDASLLDLETVRRARLADELLLIGPAIDDALLRALRDQTALGEVPRLRLIDTSVGPEGLGVVASLAGLVELWLTNNPALHADEVERYQARVPGCTVHFEPPSPAGAT
jgi:hypothetical protein